MSVDVQAYKQIMSRWSSGVSVLTTVYNGEKHGMTASSFSSLSINPLLIMACIGKTLHSHELILGSGFFAVNVLSKDQLDYGRRFAGMIPGLEDRFSGIENTTAVTGAPILAGTLGWLDCRIYTTYDGGDHTIVVGEVLDIGYPPHVDAPLMYFNRGWGSFSPLTPPGTLKHVVMFKLKEATAENIAHLRNALLALKPLIPQIREIEVGANVIESQRAYDVALTVRFDSLDDMQAYQVHPEHVRVLDEVVKPLAASIVAVDYEV